MSREKLIILGVLVLGLLGVLVWKQTKSDEQLGAPMTASKDFPTVSAPDDIDKIAITNGDKGEIDLELVADTSPTAEATDGGPPKVWMMTKPMKARASQQTVKDLVANLRDIKVDSQVNLKLDDDVKKEKQLDAAHAVHVVAWRGATKQVDDFFGKSGTAGELTMVPDKPDAVWAVKGYSAYLYTKEPKDFRDKEIFKFDDANVSQVTIANTHGTASFTKAGDKWAVTFDKQPLPRFSEDKLRDMLRAYKVLNADDFGDGKSLDETGLSKPDATVTITLKDGAGTYELLVGKTATGSNRWAKKSNDDQIYQITNYGAEWVTSDQSKWQSAVDAGAPDASKAATTAKK
ncbi:MAG TPA: DUF4340 domain-containing protein [Polyangiaceae bacterium]